MSLLSQSWSLLKGAVYGFLEDEALTRGAAIAFYTATSFAPVLLIVIAIAGLVYGQEAAQGAITTQLGDLMGRQTAELLQTAVASSKSRSSGFLAAAVGIVTLVGVTPVSQPPANLRTGAWGSHVGLLGRQSSGR